MLSATTAGWWRAVRAGHASVRMQAGRAGVDWRCEATRQVRAPPTHVPHQLGRGQQCELAVLVLTGSAQRRMPRVCAESSPQRQASWKLDPSQGQPWGLDGAAVAAARAHERAARPRHLAAAGSLAPGLPAQLGQATARIRGRGQLRQVARRAHCRARPRRLCHPAASLCCRRAPPWCRVELRTSLPWTCGPSLVSK